MPPAPPAIGRTPFFLHSCLRHELRRYTVMLTPNVPRRRAPKEDRLISLSDYPFVRRGRNHASDIYRTDAGLDSQAALRRLNNRE
jgi:hypothetical protein